MKPIKQIATVATPDGSVLVLSQHDKDFTINVDRKELMSSRRHESEVQLAKRGCWNVTRNNQPRVLVGGLGMGYTLRAALDMLKPGAKVTVSELLPEVVTWNKKYLGHLTDNAFNDKRVTVKVGDVVELLKESSSTFDTILLDIDNGPAAITNIANARLYNRSGINTIINALSEKGCVAFWSSGRDKTFERRLRKFGLVSRFFKVPVYKGAKACPVCILVASREFTSLPPLPPARVREKKEN